MCAAAIWGKCNMEIEKYEKRVRNNVAKSTLVSRKSGQRNLEQFIGGGEPTVDDVENWVDHLIDQHENGEIKASTIREYYKAVKYYFEVVKGQTEALDHISKWLPSNDSDPGEHLTEEEWDELRNKVKGFRDRALIEIMYFYARRPKEVILLNLEDVEFTDGEDEKDTITFNILKKNSRITKKLVTDSGEYDVFRATFELEKEPKRHIKRWLDYAPRITETIEYDGEEKEVEPLFSTSHGRISYNAVYKMVKEAASRTTIKKNVTPKSMGRHSRATHLDWDGNSPGNIARDVLIHDPDTDVVGRYIHDRDEEDVREIMTVEGDGEDDE